MASGKGRSASRVSKKTASVLLDESQRPLFGSVADARASAPKQKGEEPQKREMYTEDEHIDYLRLLGYPAWLIPGTDERQAMLKTFIDTYHGYEPIHQRQLIEWQSEYNRHYRPRSDGNTAQDRGGTRSESVSDVPF